MKTIRILFATVAACMGLLSARAQSGKETINDRTKTATIKVYGECDMCKKRIEKAALDAEGIRSADWDENTKTLTIKYDLFKKSATDSVQKRIAASGHDTHQYTADDAAYDKLPDCCHYQRKKQ